MQLSYYESILQRQPWALRAESNKYVEHAKLSYIGQFDTRIGFSGIESGGVMGVVRNLKGCFQALPFSLPALFYSFTISLLAHSFRSAALRVTESTDREPSTGYVLFNRRESYTSDYLKFSISLF